MATSSKLARIDSRRQSPLTPELKAFIDRVIVPILVRDYLSGIAREKQIAHASRKEPNDPPSQK